MATPAGYEHEIFSQPYKNGQDHVTYVSCASGMLLHDYLRINNILQNAFIPCNGLEIRIIIVDVIYASILDRFDESRETTTLSVDLSASNYGDARDMCLHRLHEDPARVLCALYEFHRALALRAAERGLSLTLLALPSVARYHEAARRQPALYQGDLVYLERFDVRHGAHRDPLDFAGADGGLCAGLLQAEHLDAVMQLCNRTG